MANQICDLNQPDLVAVIVFESDLDLSPEQAYRCYQERWFIELVFRYYKNNVCFDRTRVQGDYSVLGSEFINFISTVITCRIIKKLESAKLLDEMTYGDAMEDLTQVWRDVAADLNKKPALDDGLWAYATNKQLKMMEALELISATPKPEKRKPGRPRPRPECAKTKRSRGRPRKHTD